MHVGTWKEEEDSAGEQLRRRLPKILLSATSRHRQVQRPETSVVHSKLVSNVAVVAPRGQVRDSTFNGRCYLSKQLRSPRRRKGFFILFYFILAPC